MPKNLLFASLIFALLLSACGPAAAPAITDAPLRMADFFAVTPEYGTLEDLQALVEAAHDRDMYLILDSEKL